MTFDFCRTERRDKLREDTSEFGFPDTIAGREEPDIESRVSRLETMELCVNRIESD